MNLKCTFGFHKWDLVAIDNVFYTVPRPGSDAKVKHLIKFYQCTRCAKKMSYTDRKSHPGIRLARDLWSEKGMLYNSSILVSEMKQAYKYTSASVHPFKAIKGDKE